MLSRRGFIQSASMAAGGMIAPGASARTIYTSQMVEGPLYPDNFPLDTDNGLLIINDQIDRGIGEIVYLSGTVYSQSGAPLACATIEIWQTDAHGNYMHSEGALGDEPRDAARLAERSNLTLKTGSPMNAEDVADALDGVDAVLVALNNARTSDNPGAKPVSPPHLLEESVKNLAAEMDKVGVKRLVMISALGVADSFAQAHWFMRMIIQGSNAKIAFADHDKVDAFLRPTELDWTLVRAAALSNADGSNSMIVSGGTNPKPAMSISRTNLARFMLEAAEHASHIRATPVLSEK